MIIYNFYSKRNSQKHKERNETAKTIKMPWL